MFTGLANLFDLQQPNWADYFVATHIIELEYLTYQESKELLCEPCKSFPLSYEETTLEYIYKQTCGHPHILQAIGYGVVKRAASEYFEQVTLEVVESVMEEDVLRDSFAPCDVF